LKPTGGNSHDRASIKTDVDLERLLALWATVTPEAKRVFAETHFNQLDGWPAAEGIRECDAFHGAKWSRK
jgi:hypothetical protein